MRPGDIVNKSDQRSKTRAKTQHKIKAKLYKVEDNKVMYTVVSSQGDKQYLVTIQLLSLTRNKLKSLKSAIQGDLRISCSCPAFLYYGYKYITWKKQVGLEPELRSPDIRNPTQQGMACKHIIVTLEQMKKDYTEIYNLFKQKIPKDKKQSTLDPSIKNNKLSGKITESDLSLITEFKEQCTSLYNDYKEFEKSDSDVLFLDSEYYKGQDPSSNLTNLSVPSRKFISSMFVGKLKTITDIVSFIERKKSSFLLLLNSDVDSLTKKINASFNEVTESYINDIILTLMMD